MLFLHSALSQRGTKVHNAYACKITFNTPYKRERERVTKLNFEALCNVKLQPFDALQRSFSCVSLLIVKRQNPLRSRIVARAGEVKPAFVAHDMLSSYANDYGLDRRRRGRNPANQLSRLFQTCACLTKMADGE